MKALRFIGLALTCALLAAAPLRTPFYGFTAPASDRERQYESEFLDIPSAQGALNHAAAIGAHPHYAGSDADYQLALYMRDRLREYGFDAELETFTATVDTPKKLALELLPAGPRYRAGTALRKPTGSLPIDFDLHEAPEASDPDTASDAIGLPFNSGSADGDVTAPLVYVGRGRDGDYADLAKHNVDVTGAVALIRYGAEFRGNLVRRAQARGAVGVLLYSDPADDGFARGPVYPNGPWRPPTSVQRGSLGDGVHIPVLPIAATTAQALVGAIEGEPAAAPFAGAMPASYTYGRSTAAVHMIVQLQRKTTTLWNTIGRLRGIRGDQSVIVGAHRDAWVYGISDNGSGIITMLEMANGLGYLARNGWRPQRSIVIAGWDAEEIGLYGSHAYVQRHNAEIARSAVAYVNADEMVDGTRFGASAAAALAGNVVDASKAVTDPVGSRDSIWDRWSGQTGRGEAVVGIPGGGSDHESFLFGPGTPIAEMGFSGPAGAYHSSYDTVKFASTVADPTFAVHRAAAQLYGILTLRLADADVIPYRFSPYTDLWRSGLRALGTRELDGDLAKFARAARRFDLVTSRAQPTDPGRAIEAARTLDLAMYSANGYASQLFAEAMKAHALGDTVAAAAELARLRVSLQRATSLIGGV